MDFSVLESQAGINLSAIFLTVSDKADFDFAKRQLDGLPDDVARSLFKEYLHKWRADKPRAKRNANIWLRKRVAALNDMLHTFPIPIWHLQTDVRRAAIAHEWANRCSTLLHNATEFGSTQIDALELVNCVKQPADMWSFSPPMPSVKHYQKRKAKGEFDNDPRMYNAIAGAIARLTDESWWLRKLDKTFRQYQEHAAIVTGKVRAGVSAYVSYQCLKAYQQRKQAAAAWLNQMLVVNEAQGLELSLAEAVAASVANPENRRAELMVRMRGFEELAIDTGYVAEFYTITSPSRYHSWKKSKQGPCYSNKKYDGANPKQTQAYLCQQWAKARSKLARNGVDLFGFRVVEPHHDGTPHWHMVLFMRPEQLELGRGIIRDYALEHDLNDFGKAPHDIENDYQRYRARFDFKTIDPEQGSATGYLTKYIAKNIDGAYVNSDFEAESSGKHGADGVTAWASTWNIRQFQQIGGPSVTVWRELRRLREEVEGDEILERARIAADSSNWQRFVEVMGGASCKRADRTIQLAKVVNEASNLYGEDVTKIMGVMSRENHTPINTRLEGWEIRAPRDDNSEPDAFDLALDSSFDLASKSGDSRAPWSSDNNCTQVKKQPQTLSDHDRQLMTEAKKLGLDRDSIKRLRAGAVIDNAVNGVSQYVRLRNGILISSKQPPMAPNASAQSEGDWCDSHTDQLIDAANRDNNAAIDKQLRKEAWSLLDANGEHNGDVEQWLLDTPRQHHQQAMEQLQQVIELQQYEHSFNTPIESEPERWPEHEPEENNEYELF